MVVSGETQRWHFAHLRKSKLSSRLDFLLVDPCFEIPVCYNHAFIVSLSGPPHGGRGHSADRLCCAHLAALMSRVALATTMPTNVVESPILQPPHFLSPCQHPQFDGLATGRSDGPGAPDVPTPCKGPPFAPLVISSEAAVPAVVLHAQPNAGGVNTLPAVLGQGTVVLNGRYASSKLEDLALRRLRFGCKTPSVQQGNGGMAVGQPRGTSRIRSGPRYAGLWAQVIRIPSALRRASWGRKG